MSANVVGKWATAATDFERVLGNVIQGRKRLKPIFLYPFRDSSHPTGLETTLWRTGSQVIKAAAAPNLTTAFTTAVISRALCIKQEARESHWYDGVYHLKCERAMGEALRLDMGNTRRQYGAFDASWLRLASTTEDGWLLDSSGREYKLAGSTIAEGTETLGELLQWTWQRSSVVSSYPLKDFEYVLTPRRRVFDGSAWLWPSTTHRSYADHQCQMRFDPTLSNLNNITTGS